MAQADNPKAVESQACEAGEEFIKLFYQAMDKRRHVVGKFYMDSASFIWNGNSVSGTDNITKFLENLPTSEHTVEALDAQPIPRQATNEQTAILVTTGGMVKYGNVASSFSQNFILTTQGTSWKVISDCMRTTPND